MDRMDYAEPICFTLAPFVGAFVGRFATKNGMDWFDKLKKPSWNPPKYVFGPVWTTLYAGMGYGSYLIWKEGGGLNETTQLPLTLYGTQLALNWAWSPLFFGVHKLGLAAVVCAGMAGSIGACIYTYYPINQTAAYLMMPYLAWVSFATCLNIWIYQHNPSGGATVTEIEEEKKD